MNFKEAYQKMLEGKKVRRKGDNGYFYYDENTKHVYHYTSEKGFDNSTVNIEMEDALAEDWEVVEETKSKVKVWKPNKNEKYCYIGGDGEIYHTVNANLTVDYCIFSIGNYFKTDEEAEHMVEKLKVIRELQDFALEHNDEEIDWVDNEQDKWAICYDIEDKEIAYESGKKIKSVPFNVYFATEQDCERAIKKIGEDRIKKYYFDIED